MFVRASLVPAHPNSMKSTTYSENVVRCADNVPLGMSLIGFLRFLELFAPVIIPVQALKKIA